MQLAGLTCPDGGACQVVAIMLLGELARAWELAGDQIGWKYLKKCNLTVTNDLTTQNHKNKVSLKWF